MAAFCGSILGKLLAQVISSGLSLEFSAVGFLLAPLLAIAYINSKPTSARLESTEDEADQSGDSGESVATEGD